MKVFYDRMGILLMLEVSMVISIFENGLSEKEQPMILHTNSNLINIVFIVCLDIFSALNDYFPLSYDLYSIQQYRICDYFQTTSVEINRCIVLMEYACCHIYGAMESMTVAIAVTRLTVVCGRILTIRTLCVF